MANAWAAYRKNRGYWELRRRVNGKLIQSRCESQEEAENLAREVNAEVARRSEAGFKLRTSSVVLGDYAFTAWLDAIGPVVSKATRQIYRIHVDSHLRPAFGAHDLRELGQDDLREFSTRQAARGLGLATINRHLGTLRTCINWCIEQDLLTKNPCTRAALKLARQSAAAGGAREKTHGAWTLEEAKFLLDVAKEVGGGIYGPVLFAASTGARLGEILALQWEQIDLANQAIVIDLSVSAGDLKTVKNTVGRKIGIAPTLHAYLSELAEQGDAQGFVFRNTNAIGRARRDGTRSIREPKAWTKNSLQTQWRKVRTLAGERHGVTDRKFHCWRHSFASWGLAAGQDPAKLARQLGHTLEEFLRTYAHEVGTTEDDFGHLGF